MGIRIELAKLFVAGRQFDQAQHRLLWVLEQQPNNKEARVLFAATLAYLAQPDAARKQVDLLLAEDPLDSSARVLDVALHLAAHEAKEAEGSLQVEVLMSQRSTDSLVTLASFYQLVRTPEKGIALLREVLQREPKNTAVRLQLGWLYASAGDHTNAEKTFREMALVAPRIRPRLQPWPTTT